MLSEQTYLHVDAIGEIVRLFRNRLLLVGAA